ncbi:MAG: DnaB-like helicase N-terminal domain-containing protein [Desulfuromonadales bacterium]
MNKRISNRMPPQNIEAKMSVLGGILLDNEALWKVTEIIVPEDFYREQHRVILLAMMELKAAKEPCDLVTLTTALRRSGTYDFAGGASYLAILVDYVPTAANITYYCRIVKENSIARRLVSAGTEIATRGTDPKEDVTELMDYAQKNLSKIIFRKVFFSAIIAIR